MTEQTSAITIIILWLLYTPVSLVWLIKSSDCGNTLEKVCIGLMAILVPLLLSVLTTGVVAFFIMLFGTAFGGDL